jgi:hypothetical protein
VAVAPHLAERVELGGPLPGEQAVPRGRPDAGHQREPGARHPEPDRSLEAGQIAEQVPNLVLGACVDRGDQEDRRSREGGENGLRLLKPDRLVW